jgi:nucleotide-binding universal stress UspA family protein
MHARPTILHPTDFCGRCEPAFRVACSQAIEQEARLVVLHVARPPVYGLLAALAEEYERLWDNLHRMEAPDSAVRLQRLLRCGEPAREILRAAQTLGCGLIVMGTHGRTRLGRLLMGSVAEQVARVAPCTVLTVPALSPTWKQPAEEPAFAAPHSSI